MFIDSHCHLDRLDLSPYDHAFQPMLAAAHQRGVERMLCVAIDLQQFDQMYALIQHQPSVYASLGVHPLHIESAGHVPSKDLLCTRAATYERVIALGETGLDYYYQTATKALQQTGFIHHLQAGAEANLPVIVHTRNAQEDTLALIKEHAGPAAGVLHCFTESLAMAKAALDLGFLISFSGIITFKNAHELQEVVKAVPLSAMLIETDAPYLAPVPYRGKKNEPKYVVEVAECIAHLKGVTVTEVAQASRDNFYRLFPRARLLDDRALAASVG